MRKIILCLFTSMLLTTQSVWAQSSNQMIDDAYNDFVLMAACTGMGAVLGLSTLSFEDEPGEELDNILVGAAIGIILGVGFVVYKQGNNSRDSYEEQQVKLFGTESRTAWHNSSHRNLNGRRPIPQFSTTFSF